MDRLIHTMNETYNRDLSRYSEPFLLKTRDARMAATSIDVPAQYVDLLASSPDEADAFWRRTNIVHSEFFRNRLAFALLEQVILPQLVAEKSGTEEIRIWSAGCAAGQEVYSIAILLADIAKANGNPAPVRIFATDRSAAQLELARVGLYSAASLQNVRLRHLGEYFTQRGDTYAVADSLKDAIDFSTHDLLDESSKSPPASIFGEFDIAMCSNLLYYYRPDVQRSILGRLQLALSPDGYLMTGETEQKITGEAAGYEMVAPPASVFQRVPR